jgi:hypothetical protein
VRAAVTRLTHHGEETRGRRGTAGRDRAGSRASRASAPHQLLSRTVKISQSSRSMVCHATREPSGASARPCTGVLLEWMIATGASPRRTRTRVRSPSVARNAIVVPSAETTPLLPGTRGPSCPPASAASAIAENPSTRAAPAKPGICRAKAPRRPVITSATCALADRTISTGCPPTPPSPTSPGCAAGPRCTALHRDVVREQLQRHRHQHRRQQVDRLRDAELVVDEPFERLFLAW